MAQENPRPTALDPVWDRIKEDARSAIAGEPLIGGMVHSTVLHHKTLEHALAYRVAFKLSSSEMSGQLLREISEEAYASDPDLAAAARAAIACCSRWFSSRDIRRFRRTVSATGCGCKDARIWPISSRPESARFLA